MVGIMQKELVGLGPRIEQKAHDTEKLMAQLRKDTDAVNQVNNLLQCCCVKFDGVTVEIPVMRKQQKHFYFNFTRSRK